MFGMIRKLGSTNTKSCDFQRAVLILFASFVVGALAVALTYFYGVVVNGTPLPRFYMVGVYTASLCVLTMNNFWKFRYTTDGKVHLF